MLMTTMPVSCRGAAEDASEMRAELVRLRAEVGRLTEEVRRWRDSVRPSPALVATLSLSPSEATIVGLLMTRPLVSIEAIDHALYGHRADPGTEATIAVLLSRVRAKLATLGVDLQNSRGQGWSLTPAARASLRVLSRESET